MNTYIFVKNLEIMACHGCNPEEKLEPQLFVFSAKISFDAREGMLSDELSDVVCYAEIAKIINNISIKNTFNTIEKLAQKISRKIFTMFSKVTNLQLIIEKRNAPIMIEKFHSVGFCADFSRSDFFKIFSHESKDS